jgi:hypothetical protein
MGVTRWYEDRLHHCYTCICYSRIS